VERFLKEGRLKSRLQPVANRKPRVLIDPASIDALIGEARAVPASVATSAGPGTSLSKLPQLAQLLAAAVRPKEWKPWLTLDEAVEYSGLPRGWLLSQAKAGAGFASDFGSGRRRSFRFHRDSLGLPRPR
jgi:hypothetical protein